MLKVKYSKRANKSLKEIKKNDKMLAKDILSSIEGLQENPYPIGCIKLRNCGNKYRIHTSNQAYRIIYNAELEILNIIKIGQRGDIYNNS